MSVMYDAGMLIAAERNDRQAWADHRVRLEAGIVPTTTGPVVAQVSRSPRQVRLRQFLRGCHVEAFQPAQAHEVGALLGKANTSDVVDAHVMFVAAAANASTVWTSDPGDLRGLNNQLPVPVQIRRI